MVCAPLRENSCLKKIFRANFALQTCHPNTKAMRGKTVENVPFRPYSGCTENFLKALSKQRFHAMRAMRAKQCATVLLETEGSFQTCMDWGGPFSVRKFLRLETGIRGGEPISKKLEGGGGNLEFSGTLNDSFLQRVSKVQAFEAYYPDLRHGM